MYDKARLYERPAEGQCQVVLPEEVPYGPREYAYNLLPKPVMEKKGPPKHFYKSKLKEIAEERVQRRNELLSNPHRTMGPPSGLRLPAIPQKQSDFIRKHRYKPMVLQTELQKRLKALQKKKEKQEARDEVKAAGDVDAKARTKSPKPGCSVTPRAQIPTRAELCMDAGCSTLANRERVPVNHLQRNAIQHVITAVPGHRVPRDAAAEVRHSVVPPPPPVAPHTNCHGAGPKFVDTRYGDKQSFVRAKTESGLHLKHVWKPTLGKMPRYLRQRATLIEASRREAEMLANEEAAMGADYLLKADQRQNLLNGLKAAWDRANRAYLSLSSSSDTIKGRTRKHTLEAEMDTLEKDIEAIQRHEFIFVEANKSSPGLGDKIRHCVKSTIAAKN